MTPIKNLRSAALWTILLSIILKLSGFIREAVISKEFGASYETDAFALSFGFVTLTIALISSGFNNVFLPMYVGALKNKQSNSEKNASALLNYSILLFTAISVLGYFFTEQIVSLIFPKIIAQTKVITIEITQLFFMMLFLIAISAILDSYLQSRRIFVPSQVSKLSATLFAALFAFFFSEMYGIFSVVYGFGVGTLFGVIIQFIYLAKSDFSWSPTLKMDPYFRKEFFILLLPALMHSAVGQINLFIDRSFASNTTEAAVTYLNNASLIASIPNAILATTLVAIIFTLMSERKDNKEAFAQTVVQGVFLLAILLFPIAGGLAALGETFIAFVYERGKFTSLDTSNTYIVLLLYLPFVVFQGFQVIFAKSIFALSKTTTMLKISLTTIVINFILNYLFVGPFGYRALAATTSLVTMYLSIVTGYVVFKEIGLKQALATLIPLLRLIPATLIMVGGLIPLNNWLSNHSLSAITLLIVTIPIGVLLYAIALKVTYPQAIKNLKQLLKQS